MAKQAKTSAIYQLKVQLMGISKPPVWRKIAISSTDNLFDLHRAIQGAFGWYNAHLHQFWIGDISAGYPFPDGELGQDKDERKISIEKAFNHELKAKIRYDYDFGDSWEHQITLEAIVEPNPSLTYPILLGSKGACPPEDCGGIWGYENLKEVMADPTHEEHKDMLDWLDLDDASQFDPKEFDLNEMQVRMNFFYKNKSNPFI